MWHEGVKDGHWWQAKVYDEESHFGIDGGRISKLVICRVDHWDHTEIVFNFDRGPDIDNCPPEILEGIIAHCEALPKGI